MLNGSVRGQRVFYWVVELRCLLTRAYVWTTIRPSDHVVASQYEQSIRKLILLHGTVNDIINIPMFYELTKPLLMSQEEIGVS